MRVYRAYSNDVQTDNKSATNYCYSTIIQGSLAVIILNYFSICVFIFIHILVLSNTKRKIQQAKLHDMEMTPTGH